MNKATSKPSEHKSPKASHVFPAPEWTSLSASLAASLAHEIRNPLLSIKGAAQLLEQVVGEEDRSLAALIITEAKRIEQLVATMDPLTPNPAQVKEAINIHEITEYVRLAARSFAGDVTFVMNYDPSLPPVQGVREALIQALMNLVKNAVEAVRGIDRVESRESSDGDEAGSVVPPPLRGRLGEGAESLAPLNPTAPPLTPRYARPSPAGGEGFVPTITITTKYLIGERMQRIGGRKLTIQVKIEDNGPGVPEALIPRLFTPFTTSKEHGKGLGLAIVAKIIEEHEGLVAYESEAGKSAVFSLYLPQA